MPDHDTHLPAESTWAPLKIEVFRALWLAGLFGSIGDWVQTVGAQWLLVGKPHAAILVALVQTAGTFPFLILALPGGVLADLLNKRKLLLGVQGFQTVVGAVLTVLTVTGHIPSALLLVLTFLIGSAEALAIPALQALTPELVPRLQLPAASGLASMSVNLARVIGPALAGILIARLGVGFVFGFNTFAFFAFGLVVFLWRPAMKTPPRFPEQFVSALWSGTRYIRYSPVVRRILVRAGLFILPASALWALLPLIASRRLNLGPTGYGLLVGLLGTGAVGVVFVLPQLRRLLTTTRLLLVSSLIYAGVLLVLVLVRSVAVGAVVLLPAGAAWVAVLSTINATTQLFLPEWVRARGLAAFAMVLFGSQAVGAAIWGIIANRFGLVITFAAAAAFMGLAALSTYLRPLIDTSELDRAPAVYWPEPQLAPSLDTERREILVTSVYIVAPEKQEEFLKAIDFLRESRLQTGATSWTLSRDADQPDRFLEVFRVPSWEEHLRQHGIRMTGTDRSVEEAVDSLAVSPPEVNHYLVVAE